MRIIELLKQESGTEVTLKGWVRFNRASKNIGFLEIFDGSVLKGIQAVYKSENESVFSKLSKVNIWSAVELKGKIVDGKQKEVNVEEVVNIWLSNEDNPLGKKEHGLEFLREISQLRPRTKTFQSIMKIRSTLSLAVHEFFSKDGFTYVHTPILTANDAEAAGESFFVKTKDGDTFFSNQGSLTVSGQLHAEAYAQAFGSVYTFGPTFRAENSNTTKHAAEFWMIEPEAAFCDYNEMMDIAEKQTKFVIQKVLNDNMPELEQLNSLQDKDILTNLKTIVDNDFPRISYREALEILVSAQESGVEFEAKDISFGIDLGTEHEKYLAEVKFGKPVFVFDYPESIKAFYMFKNEDETVRGFDLLVPGIGELVGGSQRIDNIDQLKDSAKKAGVEIEDLQWYVNLREEGYAPSSGYGLGFERLIMLVTGVENIRDVIPFPRTPGKLEF